MRGGGLLAYYRGFVSREALDLFLTIQYVAMIIIGGMGSLLGAPWRLLTLFPYVIEALLGLLPNVESLAGDVLAVNYASFGVVMILFLVLEPLGMVGIWHRLQNWSALALQIPAPGGSAEMSAPLLQVEKVEVVYKRVITAVQGVTLSGRSARSSPCSAPTVLARPPRCVPFPAFSASTMPA